MGVRDGRWLDEQTFGPLRYAVPGVVPEGLAILVGPPKAGKSWLVLSWILAITSGGLALGRIAVGPARPVLYLALEDGDRRMQSRCRALLGGKSIPEMFGYVTQVPVGDVVDLVRAWMEAHPDTSMVVVDTLARATPGAAPGESAYRADYRIAGVLKGLADANPGLAVVAVHHDRKAEASDFVDAASGTKGLTGAADTVMLLERRREAREGLLKVTGRDVAEAEYGLILRDPWSWELDGADLAAAASSARARRDVVSDGVGELLAFVAEAGPDGARFKDVVARFGDAARTELGRQVEAGRLVKAGRGLYVAATFAASATYAGQGQVEKVAVDQGGATFSDKALL